MVYKCMMHNAHALRRQTPDDNDNDNIDRMAIDKTQCFSSSLFTLICIYNRNHLASPVSVVLLLNQWSLFYSGLGLFSYIRLILVIYLVHYINGICSSGEPNKHMRIRRKQKIKIHGRNELLTSAVWMGEQWICALFLLYAQQLAQGQLFIITSYKSRFIDFTEHFEHCFHFSCLLIFQRKFWRMTCLFNYHSSSYFAGANPTHSNYRFADF